MWSRLFTDSRAWVRIEVLFRCGCGCCWDRVFGAFFLLLLFGVIFDWL